MEHQWMFALERMAQLEKAMTWLDQLTLSPPIWPEGNDTLSTKQTQVTTANQALATPATLSQMVSALTQMEQVVQLQTVRNQRFNQVAQPSLSNDYNWQTTTATQQHTQQTHQQQRFWSQTEQVDNSRHLEAPSNLTQQTQTSNQGGQTTVTVSPTVHLQATIHEQADLEALVAKLNHLLEEEIAISAERAYT